MIELLEICKVYQNKFVSTPVLTRVDLTIKQGDMVCVMGCSGSGKSTLLNILAGLIIPSSGKYYFNTELINFSKQREVDCFRHDKIGIVLQNFALIKNITVFNNVALPLKYSRIHSKEIKKKTYEILAKLDLSEKSKCYPDELSGGQQQRVAIARALVKEPKLIIADEPTGALDEENTYKVLRIFEELNKKGMTIIVATHDINVSKQCNRIVRLKNGHLEEEGNTNEAHTCC